MRCMPVTLALAPGLARTGTRRGATRCRAHCAECGLHRIDDRAQRPRPPSRAAARGARRRHRARQRSRPLHPRTRGRGVRARVRRVLRRRCVHRGRPTAPMRSSSRCARSASARATRSRPSRTPAATRRRRSARSARRRSTSTSTMRRCSSIRRRSRNGSPPRTRAVVVTHLYGRLADVDAIARIANERGDRADRGLRAGARRAARRQEGGHLRRGRLLQLLSDEEPGRAGRCGGARHERSDAGREADGAPHLRLARQSTASRSKAG